ncbi:MAG: GNAT family N-acetyltransferase [Paludibacteraceae bacterium]
MLALREIHTSDSAYPWLEQLWSASFPSNERRDTEAQRYNTDVRTNFHCLLAEDEGTPVGFITYWYFGGFCYGEHLATDPACRNHGYGARILAALRALLDKQYAASMPFVLEVEMPTDDLSRRRIAFYERNDFTLWRDCAYMQPPYRATDTPLPMLLMAQGSLVPEQDFSRVKATIHREVYGVNL